jgi:glucose/mannose-6-phosphate isomerase
MTLNDIRRLDPDGMYDAIRTFPEQWQEGRQRALDADLPPIDAADFSQVLVVGMGGSAIGGDLLRTLALDAAAVPVFVSRSYTVPAWVGAETLVVVSSYSGNTEETLSAMEAAQARGATVVCIASGGEVIERARAQNLPYLTVPGGLQPRAALGYSLTTSLTLAERIGLLDLGQASWDETQALLEQQAEALSQLASNAALDLADALHGKLPFIYSSEGLLEAVNVRWRNQIHENAKTLATGNVWPELNHNEIMGWEHSPGLLAHIAVVVLRDAGEHPQVSRRIEVTRGLLAERAALWQEVESQGQSALARVMSLVHHGDWVSFYLAILNGVDPTPVGLIQELKQTLAKG